MRCAVYNCDHNNERGECKFNFYSFPKEALLLKKWIEFCRRGDKFNHKTSRICSAHFAAENVQRNLQFEMGYCKRNTHKLKPGAVPTLHPDGDTAISTCKQGPTPCHSKKFAPILYETDLGVIEANSDENNQQIADQKELVEIANRDSLLAKKVAALEQEILNLNEVNNQQNCKMVFLKDHCKKLEAEVKELRSQNSLLNELLAQSKFQSKNVEDKLLQIFTSGQVKKLKNGIRRQNWVEADIAQSITLYSTSAKAYKLLRRKNFPLPSPRTLQRWAQKVDISPGILEPVVKILTASTQLTESQKVCILSFDEMKIRKTHCYDRSSDTTLTPANYVQVAMLRGLMSKWKQPIFYNYDCKMTIEVLTTILAKIKECGYHVVAMVSDLGGANRGLFKALNIEVEKPW